MKIGKSIKVKEALEKMNIPHIIKHHDNIDFNYKYEEPKLIIEDVSDVDVNFKKLLNEKCVDVIVYSNVKDF